MYIFKSILCVSLTNSMNLAKYKDGHQAWGHHQSNPLRITIRLAVKQDQRCQNGINVDSNLFPGPKLEIYLVIVKVIITLSHFVVSISASECLSLKFSVLQNNKIKCIENLIDYGNSGSWYGSYQCIIFFWFWFLKNYTSPNS